MRPVPISDKMLAQFGEHAQRGVWSAPSGDLTDEEIPPVEAVLWHREDGVPIQSVVIRLSVEDRAELAAGADLVIGWPGVRVPVFMVPFPFVFENGVLVEGEELVEGAFAFRADCQSCEWRGGLHTSTSTSMGEGKAAAQADVDGHAGQVAHRVNIDVFRLTKLPE